MVAAEHITRGYHVLKSAVLDSQSFHWHDQILPISILATLHAVRGALFFRYLFAHQRGSPQKLTHIPWLQGLIVNLTLSLGGGILSSMVFGRYIPWLASNWTIPVYSLAHFLVMYSPFDMVFQTLYTFMPIVSPILVIADGISRGFSLVSAIDYIRISTSEPLCNSYVAMVLGGTAAACGGGLLVDIFGMDSLEWRFRTPNFARKLPYGVKVAFVMSIGYVAAQTPGLYFNKLIQHILTIAPEFLKPLEKVIIGDLEITDLKALACIVYSVILLSEEYSSPQFEFLSHSEFMKKEDDDHETSRESILDEPSSADVSNVSLGEKSQSSRSYNRLSSVEPASNFMSNLRKRDILHTPKRFSEHT